MLPRVTLPPFRVERLELIGPPPWRFVVDPSGRVGIPLRALAEVVGVALADDQLGTAEGFARGVGADPETLSVDAASALVGLLAGMAAGRVDPSALADVRAAFAAVEPHARELVGRVARAALAVPAPPAGLTREQLQERTAMLESLEAHRWHHTKAAAALEMPRRTFYRRMEDYGIPKGERRGAPKKAARKPARTKPRGRGR